MAIKEILRTAQRRYEGNIEVRSDVFRLPDDKQFIKMRLRIHPDDYVSDTLKIYLVIQIGDDSGLTMRTHLDHYGETSISPSGVINPNLHINLICENLNNKDIRIGARSNGARFKIVVSGMDQNDWDNNIDQGDEE